MLRSIMFVLLILTGNTIDASAQDAKSLAKKWMVEPGTESIEDQLTQVLLSKQDSTVIVAHGYYVADTYHEAYCKAYLKALHNAAKQTYTYSEIGWSSSQENLNSGNYDIFCGSESTYLQIFIKQELSKSDSYNKWSVGSDVQIDGKCSKDTPESHIESKWYSMVQIERIQIIKSMYRHTQNGKIEVELSLKIPRLTPPLL